MAVYLLFGDRDILCRLREEEAFRQTQRNALPGKGKEAVNRQGQEKEWNLPN